MCYCWFDGPFPHNKKNTENSVCFFSRISQFWKVAKKNTKVGGRGTGSYKSSFKITDCEYQASEKPVQFSKIAVLIILILLNEKIKNSDTLKMSGADDRSRVFSGRIEMTQLFLVGRFYHTTQYISTLFSFVQDKNTHAKKQKKTSEIKNPRREKHISKQIPIPRWVFFWFEPPSFRRKGHPNGVELILHQILSRPMFRTWVPGWRLSDCRWWAFSPRVALWFL